MSTPPPPRTPGPVITPPPSRAKTALKVFAYVGGGCLLLLLVGLGLLALTCGGLTR